MFEIVRKRINYLYPESVSSIATENGLPISMPCKDVKWTVYFGKVLFNHIVIE